MSAHHTITSTSSRVLHIVFIALTPGKNVEVYELSVDAISSTGTATVVNVKDSTGNSRLVKIKDMDWALGSPIFRANIDGAPRVIQCLATEILGWVILLVGLEFLMHN